MAFHPLCRFDICALSEEIRIYFGAKWLHSIGALAGMAIIQTIGHLSVFNGEIYRAIEKPELEGKVWLLGIFVYTPVYYFLAQTSIHEFIFWKNSSCFCIFFGAFIFIKPYYKYQIYTYIFISQIQIIFAMILLMSYNNFYFNKYWYFRI